MTIMWAIIAILWTLLVLIAGYLAGKAIAKNEMLERPTDAGDEPAWSSGVRGPAGPPGPDGAMGPKGDKGDPGDGVSYEEIDALKSRVTELEQRDQIYLDRFKRVEKKAGLNV